MMVGLAFLMVSTISYPSFKQLKLERRKQFDVLPLLLLFIALLIILKEWLEAVVFFGFMIYVLGGVIGHLTRRWWGKDHRTEYVDAGEPDEDEEEDKL